MVAAFGCNLSLSMSLSSASLFSSFCSASMYCWICILDDLELLVIELTLML
jgi:hypothetical protein